jgi:type IV secretion system protein TrbL
MSGPGVSGPEMIGTVPVAQAVLPPATECGSFDVGCQAGQAAESAFEQIITNVAQSAAEVVVASAAWWTRTDSINPLDPAVLTAQDATRELIGLILVGSVLVQSMRIIVSRKGEPLIMVVTGLLRYAAVSALGLTTLQLALRAADALATQLLDDAATNFALLMQGVLTDGDASFLMLLVSLVAVVLSLVQWVLMAMRQAGLLVLAAMLLLAAAGSLTRSTRGWLDKLIVWMLAMVAYKPGAAFVYYVGFTYMSSPSAVDAGSVATMATGIMVLLLAVVALPVLLKFFAWSGTQIGGGGGGGSGFLGAAGAMAMSQGYGRGPVDRAATMQASGPGSVTTAGGYAAGAASAPGAAGRAGLSAVNPAVGVAAAAGAAGAAAARGAARGMTGTSGSGEGS